MRCLQDVLPQCGMVVKVGCQTLGVSAGAASRTPLLQEPCSPGGMWCGRCSVHTGPAVLRSTTILLLSAERVAALCPMVEGTWYSRCSVHTGLADMMQVKLIPLVLSAAFLCSTQATCLHTLQAHSGRTAVSA